MALMVDDILDFIENWRESKGIPEETQLTDTQVSVFVKELHMQIAQMDFTVSGETTVIAYTGNSNDVEAWKIVDKVSKMTDGDAMYISDLPAGSLLGEYRDELAETLENIVGNDEQCINKIIGGSYEVDGKWVRLEEGSCGFGEDLLSLDDFVSSKLMGETVGASNNIIVFTPEGIDPTKVFATTELEQIFQNDTFEYINGIPKDELMAIYNAGDAGKQSVYDIFVKTSKEAVGDVSTLEDQANCIINAYSKNGDLNVESSPYTVYSCYDEAGSFVGVEVLSSKADTQAAYDAGNENEAAATKGKSDLMKVA